MVRDSKQSLSIANVPALTLAYTGTGTSTAALAANTLTIARANVHAFSIRYTPTGEETATITIDATKVILTIDGTPTNYAFADSDKNTIAKMVAVLDAVEGITCTIDAGAVGASNSNLLDAMTATDLVAAAVTATYTPADATYDLTHADRNLLSELIAELDAVSDLACTAVTTHTGNASIQLVAFEATTINTALTMTMNYATLTATFNDIGDAIGVQGWDSLALYVKVDINSSQNARLKFMAKTEVDDTDLFLMDHNRIKCPYATIPATEDYIELDSDADQLIEVVIPELYGIAAVQVQVSAGTVGETAGAITAIEYFRTKEG